MESIISKADFNNFYQALLIQSAEVIHWWDLGFIGSSLLVVALFSRNLWEISNFISEWDVNGWSIWDVLNSVAELVGTGCICVSGVKYMLFRNQ